MTSLIVLAGALLAGCQTDYHVTVSSTERTAPIAKEVERVLDGILLADGFSKSEISGEIQWSRSRPDFWWQNTIGVRTEGHEVEVILYVSDLYAKSGLLEKVVDKIVDALKTLEPRYSVKVKKHVMYGPSWK